MDSLSKVGKAGNAGRVRSGKEARGLARQAWNEVEGSDTEGTESEGTEMQEANGEERSGRRVQARKCRRGMVMVVRTGNARNSRNGLISLIHLLFFL